MRWTDAIYIVTSIAFVPNKIKSNVWIDNVFFMPLMDRSADILRGGLSF